MVIGNLTGYVSSGYGAGGNLRPHAAQEREPANQRQPVTLDAQLDPKTPNEYSVSPSPSVIPPPERTSDTKAPDKRTSQNNDPASRAFLSVANYQSRPNSIDISV